MNKKIRIEVWPHLARSTPEADSAPLFLICRHHCSDFEGAVGALAAGYQAAGFDVSIVEIDAEGNEKPDAAAPTEPAPVIPDPAPVHAKETDDPLPLYL